MNTGQLLDLIASPIFLGAVTLISAVLVGWIIYRIIFGILTTAERRRSNQTAAIIIKGIRRPAGFAIILMAILVALPYAHISNAHETRVEQLVTVFTIAALAWGLIAATNIASTLITSHYAMDDEDNLHGREIGTRVYILARITVSAIVVFGVAAALVTFPSVRAIGTTLLASAGLIGIAAGVAARPIFENLIAGVQIAFTQPIRLDDAVIVENDFGRIEQITATYVVIRCWDLRRLIVPLTYFINTPFQNWTRQTANLIGTVMLYTGYHLPVDDLRAELMEYIKTNTKWDGEVVALQVVEATENNMQIRVLVSARNAPTVFDLRCEVREHLIAYISKKYPEETPSTARVMMPPISIADGPTGPSYLPNA